MELGSPYITIYDFILLPLYLLIIYFVIRFKSNKDEKPNCYTYHSSGLFAKIFGALLFTLIYVYYYGGGDTTNYFQSSSAITRLLFQNPEIGLRILLGDNSMETFSHFNSNTGYPLWSMFLYKKDSFILMRLLVPFNILGLNYYLTSVVVLASFAYTGVWKFYKLLSHLYPAFYKPLSIAILFLPSIIFWGSGYMKDTFTFTAALWFFVNIHNIFILKKKILINSLLLLINIYLLIWLKPYILIALIPAITTYLIFSLFSIKSSLFKYVVTPLLLIGIFLVSSWLYNIFGSKMEQYGDMESLLNKAYITQQDLIRAEQYGINFYNIGEFEPSVSGILSKAPIAIVSGIYRPFIWETVEIVPLLSAIESLLLLIFFAFIIIKVGIFRFFKFLSSESPLLVSFLIFVLFLGFAVGLTSANFGALVRYRIPLLPFYLSMLVIVYYKFKKYKAINGL